MIGSLAYINIHLCVCDALRDTGIDEEAQSNIMGRDWRFCELVIGLPADIGPTNVSRITLRVLGPGICIVYRMECWYILAYNSQ